MKTELNVQVRKNVDKPTIWSSSIIKTNEYSYLQNSFLGDSLFKETPSWYYYFHGMNIAVPKNATSFDVLIRADKVYVWKGNEYIRTNIDGINIFFQTSPTSGTNIYANKKITIPVYPTIYNNPYLELYLGFLLTQPIPTGSFDLTFDYDIQVS